MPQLVNQENPIDEAIDDIADVSAEVTEIEHHIHNRERWFGKTGSQTATDWGTLASLTAYTAISGSGTWGADENDEAQLLGTADTPAITGMAKFDLHRLFMVAFSAATVYYIRIVWGTGTMADAITAGQYSDVPVATNVTPANKATGSPIDIIMPRIAAGTKVWAQCMNATDNATVTFLIGLHEYLV